MCCIMLHGFGPTTTLLFVKFPATVAKVIFLCFLIGWHVLKKRGGMYLS